MLDDTHAFQLGSGATVPDPRQNKMRVYYLPALSRYNRIHRKHGRQNTWYYKVFIIIFSILLSITCFTSLEPSAPLQQAVTSAKVGRGKLSQPTYDVRICMVTVIYI